RAHGVEAGRAGRLEPEYLAQSVEEGRRRPLPDHHRAVTLHVAVPAHRAQPGPGPPDVAAQQHEVGDHVDGGDRVLVLGDAHAPAGDDAIRVQVDLAGLAQPGFVQTRLGDDRAPGFRL